MERRHFERDRIRLISSERLVLELFLLAYLIIFIGGDTPLGIQLVWLLLALVTGVLSYVVFSRVEYSTGIGILIAAFVSVPLFFVKFQLFIFFSVFIYAFWRIHSNFKEAKSNGWPFLVLNTFVFTASFLFTMIYFYMNVDGLQQGNIIIYLVTTVLYFVVRFTVISLVGRSLHHFEVWDAGKVFGGLVGAGIVTFVFFYYFIEPLRTGIIALTGFVFGGLFMIVSKGIIAPIWDWIIAKLEEKRAALPEEEVDFSVVDFELQDELIIFGANSPASYWLFTAFVLIVALIIFIMVMRKKKIADRPDASRGFLFRSAGRNRGLEKNGQLVYDYSAAVDAVRKAFREFEQAAQSSSAPRLRGETVKEWFSRMNWGQNDALFNTYDKVRYGSHRVTEDESIHFFDELEKIKNKYFEKDV